eukprot:405260-Pelagomonas_calceolata.AAC.1
MHATVPTLPLCGSVPNACLCLLREWFQAMLVDRTAWKRQGKAEQRAEAKRGSAKAWLDRAEAKRERAKAWLDRAEAKRERGKARHDGAEAKRGSAKAWLDRAEAKRERAKARHDRAKQGPEVAGPTSGLAMHHLQSMACAKEAA